MKINKWMFPFWAAFVLAVLTIWPLEAREPGPGEKFIRIAILKDVKEVPVYLRGRYDVIDGNTGRRIFKGRKSFQTRAVVLPTGIFFDGEKIPTDHLMIKTDKDISIWIKGKEKRYRQAIDIRKDKKKGTLVVVNTVDLETYIKGILYHETSHRWPMEAFKAQAVASRTYALYRLQESLDLPYDVTSDIYSQVYGGKSAERYRTNIAVEKTEGEVLIFNNEILPAYFSSSCGGHTENAAELWKHRLPPLMGRVCRYCRGRPHWQWKKNFKSSDVEKKLSAAGIKTGQIKDIRVASRNRSDRVDMLEITARDGRVTRISGKKFRDSVGPNDVKSAKFDVVMKGYYFDLIGSGWGHGVGLCQWGAYGMAKQHFTYREILEFYYPSTEIVDDRDVVLKPPKKDKKQDKR